VPTPDRWLPIGEVYDSNMAVSSNGKWLFTYTIKQATDGTVAYGIAIFDTTSNKFLRDVASLPNCDAALLVPSGPNNLLNVLCYGTADIRTVQIDERGAPVTRMPVGVATGTPEGRPADPAMLVTSEDGKQATVLTRDGLFSRVDLVAHRVLGSGVVGAPLGLSSEATVGGSRAMPDTYAPGKRLIRFQPLRRYHKSIFVGVARNDGGQLFSELLALDASTLKMRASVKLANPVWGTAVGPQLYAVDPLGASIYVFDPTTLLQVDKMERIGQTPTVVISSQRPD